MNWDEHRRVNGTIDLWNAWKSQNPEKVFTTVMEIPFNYNPDKNKIIKRYLQNIEQYCKISSRQVAAMALAHADML